jgi:hypothetical protein
MNGWQLNIVSYRQSDEPRWIRGKGVFRLKWKAQTLTEATPYSTQRAKAVMAVNSEAV